MDEGSPWYGVTLDQDSVVIDVGALFGKTSLQIWHLFKVKHIHAVEPARESFQRLRRACQDTPVELHNLAIADKTGSLLFHEYKPTSSSLFDRHSVGSKHAQRGLNERARYSVRCVTLSDFLFENKIDKVDLTILNCEGAENGILQQLAASSKLREALPVIWTEFHPQIQGGLPAVMTMLKLDPYYSHEVLRRNRLGALDVRFVRRTDQKKTPSVELRLHLLASYPRDVVNRAMRRARMALDRNRSESSP